MTLIYFSWFSTWYLGSLPHWGAQGLTQQGLWGDNSSWSLGVRLLVEMTGVTPEQRLSGPRVVCHHPPLP